MSLNRLTIYIDRVEDCLLDMVIVYIDTVADRVIVYIDIVEDRVIVYIDRVENGILDIVKVYTDNSSRKGDSIH